MATVVTGSLIPSVKSFFHARISVVIFRSNFDRTKKRIFEGVRLELEMLGVEALVSVSSPDVRSS